MKLLATDLDGTLLVGNVLPADSKEWIEKLHDHGIMPCFATGRMWHSPVYYTRRFDFPIPVIACNGAVVFDGEGTLLEKHTLPQTLVWDLIAYAQEHQLFFQCYTMDWMILSGYKKETLARYTTEENPEKLQAPMVITDNPFALLAKADVIKFVFLESDQEKIDALRKRINQEEDVAVVQSGFQHLEVTHKNATKGKGLKTLCAHYGITLEDTIAMGDHENDNSMLSIAGVSIGVEGGDPSILEHTDYTTQPPRDGGWGRAIKDYILRSAE